MVVEDGTVINRQSTGAGCAGAVQINLDVLPAHRARSAELERASTIELIMDVDAPVLTIPPCANVVPGPLSVAPVPENVVSPVTVNVPAPFNIPPDCVKPLAKLDAEAMVNVPDASNT